MTRAEATRLLLTKTLAEAHALADLELARRRARSRRVSPKRAAGRVAKEDARQRYRDETAELRNYAYEKWGGRCLSCMALLGDGWRLHHIVGAGLRRSRQTKQNTVPLCEPCHRAAHRNDMSTLKPIYQWALANGDALAKSELERRIHKIHESREAQHPGSTR